MYMSTHDISSQPQLFYTFATLTVTVIRLSLC